jgi:hypothetical protein
MKTRLIAGILLMAGLVSAAPRIAIGVGIGVPGYYAPAPVYVAPPPAYYAPTPVYAAPAYIPPAPGPGYSWLGGYWYLSAGRRLWRPGHWAPRVGFYVGPQRYR